MAHDARHGRGVQHEAGPARGVRRRGARRDAGLSRWNRPQRTNRKEK
jgi:hypothetical protein